VSTARALAATTPTETDHPRPPQQAIVPSRQLEEAASEPKPAPSAGWGLSAFWAVVLALVSAAIGVIFSLWLARG
jgi:hypothetical protein